MQITLTEKTAEQNRLLSVFNEYNRSWQEKIAECAKAYADCVRAGIDMGERVGPSLRLLFERLADGKLIARAAPKLLGHPRMIEVMSSLPVEAQESIVDGGVEVWRGNEKTKVAFHDVAPSEAARLLDKTGGRPRLLSAEEQKQRAVPVRPRHDRIVDLRLTPAQYEELAVSAKKKGRSLPHFIIDALVAGGHIKARG